jgi:small subunit ribosomal protein S6
MCLLDNREVRKGWEPLKDAVSAIFTKHGAEVLSTRRWDERRLGYAIRGQQRGTFLLTYFKADTQTIGAITRDLKFSDAIMRFLTVLCDDVPETAYQPEEEFDVTAIPADDDYSEQEEPEARGRSKDEDAADDDATHDDAAPAEDTGDDAESETADSTDDDEAKAEA